MKNDSSEKREILWSNPHSWKARPYRLKATMNAKSNAINQGIDHDAYEEIDMKKWLSYRDFTIKMLKDEGYDI